MLCSYFLSFVQQHCAKIVKSILNKALHAAPITYTFNRLRILTISKVLLLFFPTMYCVYGNPLQVHNVQILHGISRQCILCLKVRLSPIDDTWIPKFKYGFNCPCTLKNFSFTNACTLEAVKIQGYIFFHPMYQYHRRDDVIAHSKH